MNECETSLDFMEQLEWFKERLDSIVPEIHVPGGAIIQQMIRSAAESGFVEGYFSRDNKWRREQEAAGK